MTTLPIKHFEHYIIFEDGCIINSRNGERINGVMNEGGYIRMHLSSQGKAKALYLHRILAMTFLLNPNNHPEVDHIDRCRDNNNLSNLRWVSRLENAQNKGIPKTNKSGCLGIFERGNRWIYSKTIDGTRHYKYFDSKIEALIYKKEFLENLNLEYI
jgi:hypothetical protein